MKWYKNIFLLMLVSFMPMRTAHQSLTTPRSTPNSSPRTPTSPGQSKIRSSSFDSPRKSLEQKATPDETRSHRTKLRDEIRFRGPEQTLENYLSENFYKQ